MIGPVESPKACSPTHRTRGRWWHGDGPSERATGRSCAAFLAETGLGFNEWRTCARITAALPHLAAGTPVAVVAGAVGYRTASAFGAAFRRTMDTTPSAYFGPAQATHASGTEAVTRPARG